MTRVHLVCGKVGAGKSTYSRRLADERGAIVLDLDEWTLHLYDDASSRETFDARVALCIELMTRIAERLVPLGTEVVLDCGFWRRRVRDEVRKRIAAAGGEAVLHVVDAPPAVRWERIVARNANLDAATYRIDRDMFDQFETWFEPPSGAELGDGA